MIGQKSRVSHEVSLRWPRSLKTDAKHVRHAETKTVLTVILGRECERNYSENVSHDRANFLFLTTSCKMTTKSQAPRIRYSSYIFFHNHSLALENGGCFNVHTFWLCNIIPKENDDALESVCLDSQGRGKRLQCHRPF